MKMAHISDTGSCVGFGEVKVGDSLSIGAKYNTTQQPLNKKMSGVGNAPIMGICQVSLASNDVITLEERVLIVFRCTLDEAVKVGMDC